MKVVTPNNDGPVHLGTVTSTSKDTTPDRNSAGEWAHLVDEDVEDLPLDRFFYFESEKFPSCLLLHVKEIKMICMMGDLDELEVMRYLSKNSKVLKRFSVAFTRNIDSKIKKYLQHQISRFPRGFDLLEVEF
ncbi:hypothetical protein LWI29_009927 [Acer saccharum]|uniref:FBD domain-containing protein n=1 Tax=Acer saccharum TaxID=4024 RepID=A0AA39VAV2_ACESA|nr:hypothetical protein LWI29_009927 [Acer saccharum]